MRSGSDLCLSKIHCDFAELFEGGFEVFDDFLSEDVGGREDCRILRVFGPEDVAGHLVAVMRYSESAG